MNKHKIFYSIESNDSDSMVTIKVNPGDKNFSVICYCPRPAVHSIDQAKLDALKFLKVCIDNLSKDIEAILQPQS